MSAPSVPATAVWQEAQATGQVALVDVRTPAEFDEVHATPARNLPLDRFDAAKVRQTLQIPPGQPIYLICKSGSRAGQAAQKCLACGEHGVLVVEGGTQAWEAAGLPVVRGRKMMSLERQVRIAAGFLILVGAVLALVVDLWWVLLCGFIGAGLMFAGITDTCGMGMLIAKMPWNQRKAPAASCPAA